MHLITVIKWELFRKYHIKQCVFRDDVLKTNNILSFHTAWVGKRHKKAPKAWTVLGADSLISYVR